MAKYDAFEASCVSQYVHDIETLRLKHALDILKNSLVGDLGDIIEMMAGCGRNLPTLHAAFIKSNI